MDTKVYRIEDVSNLMVKVSIETLDREMEWKVKDCEDISSEIGQRSTDDVSSICMVNIQNSKQIIRNKHKRATVKEPGL